MSYYEMGRICWRYWTHYLLRLHRHRVFHGRQSGDNVLRGGAGEYYAGGGDRYGLVAYQVRRLDVIFTGLARLSGAMITQCCDAAWVIEQNIYDPGTI